jgi:hypothetical protein
MGQPMTERQYTDNTSRTSKKHKLFVSGKLYTIKATERNFVIYTGKYPHNLNTQIHLNPGMAFLVIERQKNIPDHYRVAYTILYKEMVGYIWFAGDEYENVLFKAL